jgi:PTH1 family peptidyl-tRNA hydrolase
VLAVLGLGNPGEEYRNTRHNVGFRVVEAVAQAAGASFGRRRFESLVAEAQMGNGKVLLCKPQTFMNESGRAARAVRDFFNLDSAALLVVCDDFNLETGRLRARRGGSSGGHNGLESVTRELGTGEFPRLRLGIGAATGGTVGYVLGRFRTEEREAIDRAVERAADAVRCWASEGIEACMNTFNAPPASGGAGAEDRDSAEGGT